MIHTPRFSELPRFPVAVGSPSQAGSLVPILDSDDLSLESPISDRLDYRFGGNIASLLIIDIDVSSVIGSVEVLVAKPHWQVIESDIAIQPCNAGVLTVPILAQEISVEKIEPRFLWNRVKSQLLIEVETLTPETKWVSLSQDCFALINDSFLAGFVVRL